MSVARGAGSPMGLLTRFGLSSQASAVQSILIPCRRDITSTSVTTPVTTIHESIYVPVDRRASGYSFRLLLVGTASAPGNAQFDGGNQPAASGETGLFEGVIGGDVSGVFLEQYGYNVELPTSRTTAGFLQLRFAGAASDMILRVGSAKGKPENVYGANGCALSFAGETRTWGGARTIAYGALRCRDTAIDYSDQTSYDPNPQPSYGVNTSAVPQNFTMGGRSVSVYFDKGSASQTGAEINGVKYGFAAQYFYGGGSGLRTPDYAGCALLELFPGRRSLFPAAGRRLP